MLQRLRTYLIRRKANKAWKEEKRKKWLSEGMTLKEIKEKLKVYKVHF